MSSSPLSFRSLSNSILKAYIHALEHAKFYEIYQGHLIDLYPIIVVNFQNNISVKNISLLFDDQNAFLFFL